MPEIVVCFLSLSSYGAPSLDGAGASLSLRFSLPTWSRLLQREGVTALTGAGDPVPYENAVRSPVGQQNLAEQTTALKHLLKSSDLTY